MVSLLLATGFCQRSQGLMRVGLTWVISTSIVIVGVRRAFLVQRVCGLLTRFVVSMTYCLKTALARLNYRVIHIFASALVFVLANLALKVIELLLELIDLLGIQNIRGLLLLLLQRDIDCVDLLARSHNKLAFSSRRINLGYFWRRGFLVRTSCFVNF